MSCRKCRYRDWLCGLNVIHIIYLARDLALKQPATDKRYVPQVQKKDCSNYINRKHGLNSVDRDNPHADYVHVHPRRCRRPVEPFEWFPYNQ